MNSPPSGIQSINVVFTFGIPVNAVGGAYSLSNVDSALGGQTASGQSGAAQATAANTVADSRIFDLLADTTGTGQSLTANPGPGQAARWSASQFTGLLGVLGASSDRGSATGGTSVRWTLIPSAPWELATAEVRAIPTAVNRLVKDAIGATYPSPSSLNLRNFTTLDDAIKALPSTGGEIYIPSGIYTIPSTVIINKENVTLRGEGTSSILRAASPTFDMIRVDLGGHHFRMYNLKLDGNATAGSNGSCLFINGSTQTKLAHCVLQDVMITRAGKYGLRLKDTILLHAIGLEVLSGLDVGIFFETFNFGLRFYSCSIVSNAKVGVHITGQVNSVTFFGCQFENNQTTLTAAQSILIEPSTSVDALIQILSCYFEEDGGNPIINVSNAPGTVIDGCSFAGHNAASYAVRLGQSPGTRISNCFAVGLTGGLVEFFSGPSQAILLGNRGADAVSETIVGGPAFNLKTVAGNGLVLLYGYSNSTRPAPNSVPPGSLIWNSTDLQVQVSNGSVWQAL